MALAERTAQVVWQGNLTQGNGTISLNSHATGDLPVTWAARTEEPGGKTSPEELIAAAHAACYAMAFSNTLNQNGTPPEQLNVSATLTLDRVDGAAKITIEQLDVHGRVPGLDQSTFEQLAKTAEERCPVSNALRNNVEIRLNAQLDA
jgi:lipoyl-dependent peroxiredoxin